MKSKITPTDELRELWKKFAALYSKPGRTVTYEDTALKLGIDLRQARELLNWSVGEELTRVVQRGLFEILPEQRPESWNKAPNHSCDGCGKEFYFNGFKRWCSTVCAEKARIKPISCHICGKMFYTKLSNKKMCSTACRNEHLRREGVKRYEGKTAAERADLVKLKEKTEKEAADAAKRGERRRARRAVSRFDKRQWKEETA